MIIMQTEDAQKRRQYIESRGLAKVITNHEHGDTVFVQYHPKGIKGINTSFAGQQYAKPPRWHDARARQPHTNFEQSQAPHIPILALARMRPGL